MVTLVFQRQPARPWHAMALQEVVAALGSTASGLTSIEAAGRLATTGSNTIPHQRPVTAWRTLLDQLRSVIVWLLVAACAVALATADLADALAIGAVLLLNVALGFALEMRAHRAVEALSRLEARRATVVRDGIPREMDAHDVVPGDVVLLEAGQAVPADARLMSGAELRLNEATLTGESVPVAKQPAHVAAADAALQERPNMVYAGTSVVAGTARTIVVATGADTELGAIGRLVSGTEEEQTPLERRLALLGRQLVWVALLVGAATGVLGWAHHQRVGDIIESAIALAVAAVPEGLPAVATITLALAVHRMARRRAVVRRLPAVEALGSVTVLCTDKTGTLTEGAMTVTSIRTSERAYSVTGSGYEPVGEFRAGPFAVRPDDDPDLLLALRIGVIANRANAVLSDGVWVAHGDPTDAALIVAARKAHLERNDTIRDLPEAGEVPFSSDRKLMATFHRAKGGQLVAFVKGAPQTVLERCDRIRVNGEDEWLCGERRHELFAANAEMAARGLRVLAVAEGAVAHAEEAALVRLTFVALVGMNDPPAPHVKEAIAAFRRAGIGTVMITGDQRGTAETIAHELGLSVDGHSLDGHDVDRLSDEELRERLRNVSVLSRVSPTAKLRIVRAYQDAGDLVAMIGDGVNDAAALKRADVGVTMGRRGTDVARETADVVLEDDRFETIGAAIEEGRVVFDNIRKFVFYLFSCNLAEILVLLGTSAAGLPLPLAPVQVLWMNLVTDTVPALALAMEPASPDVMQRPPRDPQRTLLSRDFVGSIAGHALLIAVPTFVVIRWAAVGGAPADEAMTMSFMTLALAQVFHLGNARDERPVLAPARALANAAAVGAVVIAVSLQMLAAFATPVAVLLHVVPLSARQWIVVAIASVAPAVAGQALKLGRRA